MNFFRKELIYVIILLLGSMSFGLMISYWSPCKISMIDSLEFTDSIGTLFNFLAPFASIFGGPFINLFINKIGRNTSIFVSSVLNFLSWIAMSYSKSNYFYLALIARFLLGFSVGSFSAIIPIYIDDINGSYIILHQFGISIGVSICYLIGIWLKWREIALISAIPAGLLSILIWFVPESSIVPKQNEENTVKEPLFQKKYINQLFISIALMFFQQFAGTPAFLANLNDIFNKSSINCNSHLASFIVGLTGAASILIICIIIRFCGRKITWCISSAGQAIVLTLSACNNKWKWSPVIPIVLLILDNCLFSIGLTPIPWILSKELFDDSVKSTANSVVTAINWCFMSVIFFLWDVMESALGLTYSFAIFAAIMAISSIFGIFAFPKSQGVEDTQNNFNEKSNSKNQEKLLDQLLI